MHWLLGVVALIGLIVLLALAVLNERASSSTNIAAQTAGGEADQLAVAATRNAAAVQSMGMRKFLRDRWLAVGDSANAHAIRTTDVIGGLSATSKAFRLLLQSAILGTGAYLAIKGIVSPGVMIAAAIIASRALAPAEVVTAHWRNFALTATAFQRLKNFIGDAEEEIPRTSLPAPMGALTLDKVYCQPGASKAPILKGVSFKLAAGEALGIVGPSAAGKSTLARAIVGVEPCAAGEVRLDDANIVHWDADALGKHLGYLPQDVELFSGTAAENICRFDPEASADNVIAAAQAAGAHSMILGFPDGYDTQIGERGRHLSAGQRQRLGLARALYGDPSLVVLDEPNSNLDAEGDAALAAAMKVLKERGATVIMVAHRPSAVAFVDKLLILGGGEVKAIGPRDEILARIAPGQVTPFNRPNKEGATIRG